MLVQGDKDGQRSSLKSVSFVYNKRKEKGQFIPCCLRQRPYQPVSLSFDEIQWYN